MGGLIGEGLRVRFWSMLGIGLSMGFSWGRGVSLRNIVWLSLGRGLMVAMAGGPMADSS